MVDLRLDARVLVVAIALSLVTGVGVRAGADAAGDAGRSAAGAARRQWTRDRAIVAGSRSRTCSSCSRSRCRSCCSAFTSVFLQMLDASRAQRLAMRSTASRCSRRMRASPATTRRRGARTRLDEAAAPHRSAAWRRIRRAARGLPMQHVWHVRGRWRSRSGGIGARGGKLVGGTGLLRTAAHPAALRPRDRRRDRADTPKVAVISETMARRYFGAVNAVGRRFRLDRDEIDQPGNEWYEVIGVVRDTGTADLQGRSRRSGAARCSTARSRKPICRPRPSCAHVCSMRSGLVGCDAA